jgi:signal transduction histidine kinase
LNIEVVAGWSETQADCRLVFEDNAQPMWVCSDRGIVDVNRAALLKYDFSRDEFLSLAVEDLEAPGSLAGPVIAGARRERLLGRHKKKDGTLFDVELSSFAITFGGMPATLRCASDVTYLRRTAAHTDGLGLLLDTRGCVTDVTALHHAEDTIRVLLANVIAAQEGERRRIARELDDEMAQTLASILLGLRTIGDAQDLPGAREGLRGLRASVAAAIHGVKRIASGLRPSILDHLGLEPALEHLAREVSRGSGFFVDLRVTGAPARRLPESMEIALYRIAQEALTNARKHAAAKTVGVLIHRNDRAVRLVIEDDGRGFDVAAGPSETRLGILGMRERAAFIGGSMTVRSSVSHGTTLRISAPLPPSFPVSVELLS